MSLLVWAKCPRMKLFDGLPLLARCVVSSHSNATVLTVLPKSRHISNHTLFTFTASEKSTWLEHFKETRNTAYNDGRYKN